jgi:hypothetical protein
MNGGGRSWYVLNNEEIGLALARTYCCVSYKGGEEEEAEWAYVPKQSRDSCCMNHGENSTDARKRRAKNDPGHVGK